MGVPHIMLNQPIYPQASQSAQAEFYELLARIDAAISHVRDLEAQEACPPADLKAARAASHALAAEYGEFSTLHDGYEFRMVRENPLQLLTELPASGCSESGMEDVPVVPASTVAEAARDRCAYVRRVPLPHASAHKSNREVF